MFCYLYNLFCEFTSFRSFSSFRSFRRSRHSRYKQIKKLGQGKNGEVSLAKDLEAGMEVAIKRISRDIFRKRELEFLRLISSNPHNNIGGYHTYYEDTLSYYLVLEYVRGMELFNMIENLDYFTEAQAKLISYQIFKGINHLHGVKICHRDIKPENIIINNNLEIKIIDFGLSAKIEEGRYMNQFVGTSYYLPPEVICRKYTHKCDIWSAGILLYILLVGYPPYYGDSDEEIIGKIRDREYGVPKRLSKKSVEILGKLLVLEDKRLTASEVIKDPYYLGDGTDS